MSKLVEKVELYTSKIKEIDSGFDAQLLEKVTKGLGPSIYNKDSETIACSDPDELKRVKDKFLRGKLILTNDDQELDGAIAEVCEKMGTSNKNKYRAIFYYFLVVKFNKQNIYA